jgi:hypothetical protein
MSDDSNRRSYIEASGREIEIIYPGPRSVNYANNAQLRVSMYDFVLELGVSIEATPERLVVRNMTVVALSPPHAKAIAKLLNKHVEGYEQRYGKLPDDAPEMVAEPLKANDRDSEGQG